MYYFVANITGGSGRAAHVWKQLRDILKKENIEYKAYRTKRSGDAGEIAHRIVDTEGNKDIKEVVVVGGDGTINEVLNGIEDLTRVRLGLIPCGSGNDFARGLGVPLDVEQAWDRIKHSKGIDIDIGEVIVRDRIADVASKSIAHRFGISAGIGLDAIVCRKVSQTKMKSFLNLIHLGQLSYIAVTVINLFTMKTANMRVMRRIDDNALEDEYRDTIFIAAMNMRAEGGGVKMCPDAYYDDGILSVCSAHGVPKWKAFFLLPFLSRGKHVGKKGFFLSEGEEITIKMDRAMTVHADGEYLGEHTDLIFRTGDLKLTML